MEKARRSIIFAACCLSLSSAGCAVPYFASVRGPIHRIRVLDAATGADIPEATASLTSLTSTRFLGPPPCSLTCPDLVELQAGKTRGVLLRNADLSFHVSRGLGQGSWGFFTGRPEDPNEYPRGVVIVTARSYRPAMLRYTVGFIQPGWSCAETIEPDGMSAPPAAACTLQGGRCELGDDGVLKFFLQRLSQQQR